MNMKKLEATIAQPKWNKYIDTMHSEFKNGTRKFEDVFWSNVEIKYAGENLIYWTRWNKKSDARQLVELVECELYGYYLKQTDADPRQKKFDCSLNKPSPGYLAIYWNLHKKFTVIRIGDFLAEKINSTEKSLSYTKACEIAERIVKV